MYVFVGKESNKVFSTDLEPFFDFARDIRSDRLKANCDNDNDLMTFEDVTYPMDMSA